MRPVIVLNSFGIYTALVVPLTTSTKENKYHFDCGEIAGEKSFAIITQIRLLDTKRFVEKSGKVDIEIFNQLKEAIKTLF